MEHGLPLRFASSGCSPFHSRPLGTKFSGRTGRLRTRARHRLESARVRDRRKRAQRHSHHSALGVGWVWPGCSVERRFSSFHSYAVDERTRRLLRGLRRLSTHGTSVLGRIRLFRPVFGKPWAPAWKLLARNSACKIRRLRSKPRSSRQPDAWGAPWATRFV